jgi:hypothetical protein
MKKKIENKPEPVKIEQRIEPKSIDNDLADAMMSKFIQANAFYLIGILSFTLFLVFAVQGGVFHVAGTTGRALLFYLFASLLFMTGTVCVSRGAGLYKYH